MTVTCYQSPLLTLFHGFMNGMAIEGGCRFGFDAVWQLHDIPGTTVEIFDRWFHTEPHKHSKS